MYLILLHVPCPHLLNSYLCKTFGADTQRPRPRTRPATSGGRCLGDPHIWTLINRAVLSSARTVIWDIRFYNGSTCWLRTGNWINKQPPNRDFRSASSEVDQSETKWVLASELDQISIKKSQRRSFISVEFHEHGN